MNDLSLLWPQLPS